MAEKKIVLVIEDDESVRGLVVRALAETYTTHQAGDGATALRMLETLRPHLILCDVMMPGMSGTELVRHIKQSAELKSIPVIFLTAKTGPLDVIDGINAGARSYITKPFQMKDLLERVAKAIR